MNDLVRHDSEPADMNAKAEKISKIRLDQLLVMQGLTTSRERARALILAGEVLVDEQSADKAGMLVSPQALIRVKGKDSPFVSRGGQKLEGALEAFEIDVRDLVVLDVGASTGGFTDCLLQKGARHVYALDVGYGQLAWKLRTDPRVTCIERTNIRFYDGTGMDAPVDLLTIDASFISLKLVIPAAVKFLKKSGVLLALIKPQFEVGKGQVGKGGVVRKPELHQSVLEDMALFLRNSGLEVIGTAASPLLGPKGNREFFIYARLPVESS
ncbi:MAG: 16S/23S rRNA (cytidine-2'-O)-methyltransferase TlyA [Syntrophus sp. PtaU1.Bin208]|nr:MAG: 16S/23S rRNA (cytidine-2'-O)-methyltransferase TlyA [Syntrophus sp. PtaU1.Bin208]